MKKVDIHIIFMIVIIGTVYLLHRQTVRYNELSSEYGVTTVCHVYDKHTVRGATYYDYIYKVRDNYYTSSVGGVNATYFHREPVQCFLLVYHKIRPSHHTILRDKKMDEILELGIILKNPNNFSRLIEKNTTSINTAVPNADRNDVKEEFNYRYKSRQ